MNYTSEISNEYDVCKELIGFTQSYLDLWQATLHYWLKSETLFGMDSDCVTQLDHTSVYWKPVQRPHPADFVCLLQNQIAHVFMQKRLKRPPTFFLGTLEDDTVLLSLHGEAGYIGIEKLIEGSYACLASSLETFLRQLKPECNA